MSQLSVTLFTAVTGDTTGVSGRCLYNWCRCWTWRHRWWRLGRFWPSGWQYMRNPSSSSFIFIFMRLHVWIFNLSINIFTRLESLQIIEQSFPLINKRDKQKLLCRYDLDTWKASPHPLQYIWQESEDWQVVH